MFIKDGKSLFNNTGLIIAIIILVILLVISYNKCMAPIELFEGATPKPERAFESTSAKQPTPEPQDVRISINGGNVKLNFTLNITNNAPLPKKFLVVLAQYDSSQKNTGNNKFYLSNEYELNTSVSANQETYKTNLCTLVNGLPSCSYVFSNLDTMDANGNLYYYKVGISSVYDWGNSRFVIPYNVNSSNKLFTLDSSIEQQDNLYNEFLQYKKKQSITHSSSSSTSNTLATADGQYELIKSQLGNYPSNLVLDPTSARQNLLSDLVDKSMDEGKLNINVSVPKPSTN
jgi:hypothetical protein